METAKELDKLCRYTHLSCCHKCSLLIAVVIAVRPATLLSTTSGHGEGGVGCTGAQNSLRTMPVVYACLRSVQHCIACVPVIALSTTRRQRPLQNILVLTTLWQGTSHMNSVKVLRNLLKN